VRLALVAEERSERRLAGLAQSGSHSSTSAVAPRHGRRRPGKRERPHDGARLRPAEQPRDERLGQKGHKCGVWPRVGPPRRRRGVDGWPLEIDALASLALGESLDGEAVEPQGRRTDDPGREHDRPFRPSALGSRADVPHVRRALGKPLGPSIGIGPKTRWCSGRTRCSEAMGFRSFAPRVVARRQTTWRRCSYGRFARSVWTGS
jgi:hypothetical protein